MSMLLVFNGSIHVFASDLNDGVNDGYDRFMGGTNIKGFNSWDITDKKSLYATNIGSFFAELGMYIKGDSNESLMNIFTEHLIETKRIENADSIDDYIASHLTANQEETELYISNDMTDAMYETALRYIEENTGYFLYKTAQYDKIIPLYSSSFTTSMQLNALRNYIANSDSSKVFILTNSTLTYNLADGTTVKGYAFTEFDMSDKSIVYTKGSYNRYLYGLLYSSETWLDVSSEQKKYVITEDGTIIDTNSVSNSLSCNTYGDAIAFSPRIYYYWGYELPPITDYQTKTIDSYGLVSRTGISYRVYWTLDDMKNYSVGTRPYYATSDFYNYNSSDDNSTTITQTEIDNSITYGDVYNYITNNYENPDGLSEDELRSILAEYLASINNSGGGSGGSGSSGDSGNSSSGGGLSGFLDGLGSIGNAILAILGKLMEILGSAIELVTGSITDLITIIPNSIGDLLGALFPVFPEEWIKAITLSLVLGVVVGIVRMFK